MDDFQRTNLDTWEERAPAHAASPDYHVEELVSDPAFVSEVIQFDLPRLGDVAGLDVVHLQCHIGTDTVSLAKLGARVTGLDFSAAALAQARALAERVGVDVRFVESELYAAPAALGATYDLVYTGVGALNWLSDIAAWADVVATLLRPGGRLHLREGHPMLWTLADPRPDGLLVVEYPYRETVDPAMFDEPGTYVRTDVRSSPTTARTSGTTGWARSSPHSWRNGLRLTMLEEHDSVPWDALPGMMDALPDGEFRLRDRPERLAHSYTLQAVKDG